MLAPRDTTPGAMIWCQGFVFLLPPGGPRAGNPTWYVMYGMVWHGMVRMYVYVFICFVQ